MLRKYNKACYDHSTREFNIVSDLARTYNGRREHKQWEDWEVQEEQTGGGLHAADQGMISGKGVQIKSIKTICFHLSNWSSVLKGGSRIIQHSYTLGCTPYCLIYLLKRPLDVIRTRGRSMSTRDLKY